MAAPAAESLVLEVAVALAAACKAPPEPDSSGAGQAVPQYTAALEAASSLGQVRKRPTNSYRALHEKKKRFLSFCVCVAGSAEALPWALASGTGRGAGNHRGSVQCRLGQSPAAGGHPRGECGQDFLGTLLFNYCASMLDWYFPT